MNIFLSSFESMGVLFVVAFIGVCALRRHVLPGDSIRVLSILAIQIALPCHIFHTIITKFDPVKYTNWWRLPLIWAFFSLGAALFTFIALPLFSKRNRRECAMALFYQNAVFVPLILITQLFGVKSSHLVDLFLFTMLFPAFFFSTQSFFNFKTPGNIKFSRILPAALIATVIALTLRFLGADSYVPSFVLTGVKMVGLMATPSLLILLGGSIYLDFRRHGSFVWRDVLPFVVLKNIIMPMLMLALLFILQLPGHIAFLLLLQSAVPPVTSLPVVAEKNGANMRILNQILFSSFLASAITIPLALYAGSMLLADFI